MFLSREGSKETTDDDDAHSLGLNLDSLKPVFMVETRVRKIRLRREREREEEKGKREEERGETGKERLET